MSTTNVTEITQSTAKSGGGVTDDGGSNITVRGVCWSTKENPTIIDNKTENGPDAGSFTSNITGLSPSTIYYIRAYATNKNGTGYGNAISFSTLGVNNPILSTSDVTEITQTTAKSGGSITDDGGSSITARGVCWSTKENPTIIDNKTENGPDAGSFTSNITGLSPSTTYYIRAYATNKNGTGYGNAISFSTLGSNSPILSTTNVTEITQVSVKSGGIITDDKGETVTTRGVCWSTNENPTINDSKTQDGAGAGSFTSNITDLSPGTTYNIRAYATNKNGTGYGENTSFTTLRYPVLTTSDITEITQKTAKSGGNISDNGGSTVTARGVCWSTSQNPTINDNKTVNGSGVGNFVSDIINLTPGTTYFVRAYATNSGGTGYGEVKSFTVEKVNFPTVTSSEVTNIKYRSAVLGGNIIFDGGTRIIERGVCWSKNINPTINDNKKEINSYYTLYSDSITTLEPSTTYFYRAYATNSEGTGYGSTMSFTTLQLKKPILSTIKINEISQVGATSGGSITDDGGSSITARGVCWSTSPNPTITNNKTNDDSGIGNFKSFIYTLEPNTTYYVRAYATNGEGTGYGDEASFKTYYESYLMDGSGFQYYSTDVVVIGKQEWFKKNLVTTKYNDGEPIPLVDSNSEWSNLTTAAYWSPVSGIDYEYGLLYNWHAVNTGKLCPKGYHVPTDDDWTELANFLGGDDVAGLKLRVPHSSMWVEHWYKGDRGGSIYGFGAFPNGYRTKLGNYESYRTYAFWWNSTQYDSNNAWFRYIYYDNDALQRDKSDKRNGFSVRCVRDVN